MPVSIHGVSECSCCSRTYGVVRSGLGDGAGIIHSLATDSSDLSSELGTPFFAVS